MLAYCNFDFLTNSEGWGWCSVCPPCCGHGYISTKLHGVPPGYSVHRKTKCWTSVKYIYFFFNSFGKSSMVLHQQSYHTNLGLNTNTISRWGTSCMSSCFFCQKHSDFIHWSEIMLAILKSMSCNFYHYKDNISLCKEAGMVCELFLFVLYVWCYKVQHTQAGSLISCFIFVLMPYSILSNSGMRADVAFLLWKFWSNEDDLDDWVVPPLVNNILCSKFPSSIIGSLLLYPVYE
jgi:hypothetical protein